MRTILSAMLALSVLAAVAAPASAGHADPRNPAVEIPDHYFQDRAKPLLVQHGDHCDL